MQTCVTTTSLFTLSSDGGGVRLLTSTKETHYAKTGEADFLLKEPLNDTALIALCVGVYVS